MYERTYGDRYAALGTGYVTASEIAKLMRADIKAEIAAGRLPGATSNYSVRVHNYSGGRAIYIDARDLAGMWQVCDGVKVGSRVPFANGDGWTATACNDHWCAANNDSPHARPHDVLTVEGLRVQGILRDIHNGYNYDGSNSMIDYFDVNYYGSASIEDERHAAFRAQETARKAARKAARGAA